jgi:hypothetical protein
MDEAFPLGRNPGQDTKPTSAARQVSSVSLTAAKCDPALPAPITVKTAAAEEQEQHKNDQDG